MQCVCVACGGECVGGLWGVWMGHGGVVADSPHPHHGHLWCVLVEVVGGSCGKCCEGVAGGMCEWCSGVLWGAALQRKLTCSLRRPPVPHPPTPVPDLPPKSCSYKQHSQQRRSFPVGITSPPVADSCAARTCVCGYADFWGHHFFWCLVRPGGAHRQPDQLTRPDLRLRGHGRDGGG